MPYPNITNLNSTPNPDHNLDPTLIFLLNQVLTFKQPSEAV